MAEFSGYMYGSFAPVPNIYHRAARDKKASEENPATQSSRKQPKPPLGLRRAQSATRAGSSSNTNEKKEKTSFASRFRGHTRTQSGSSASFSSAHEDAAARTARASSSPVRTSKDSSSGHPEPRSSKSKPPPPTLPTLQTQLYLDDEEQDDDVDDDDDSDHHHNHNQPPGPSTGASSSSPRPAAVITNKLRKPATPTGSSSSRGRLPLAPVSGPWDDVSPYTYFPFGRARASADQQQQQRRPATGHRASTEPPLPSSPSSHPPLPLPSTDCERGRVRSGSGLEPQLDDSSSDRLTRPSSRGRATLTGTLDRFHVPRFLSSSTASPSSEQTPSTPTPTTTSSSISTAQAQAQAQAQAAPSPFSMDIFHGAALTIWDQPKIPPPYPPPPTHHHHHQHARSPDHSSSPSSSITPNNPNTTTAASPQSNHRDRAAYFHASSSSRLTPASINVANLTEHITTASVAANAAMAASSPYGSKNVSNPSIDASLTGTGRGSTSTSLSRIPSSPSRPFTLRAGRTYLADPTLPYPLPVDLSELHRQSLRTLLQIQVFGAPICSSAFASRPPARVLEVGCGSGFWSMMCHRYFSSRGHANISFVGMDVAPLAPSGSAGDPGSGAGKPDRDMKWRFVQHDMRQTPWPFPDGEFDLVMAKEVFMGITGPMQQAVMDEYLRILRPGGVLEIWESDHQVRMLRPHAQVTKKKQPPPPPSPVRRKKSRPAKKSEDTTDDDEDNDEDETTGDSSSDATETEEEDDDDDDDDETSSSSDDEASAAASIGAYVMTANTPLSAPLNSYLVEFNTWINRALQSRDLSAVPCTILGPLLLQEADELMDVRSRRLAIPLAEVRWEREGVGGVVTKDGKSYIDSGRARREAAAKGKAAAKSVKRLTAGQAAVRRTAMLTVVQLVQSLEPLLRESSGKSQDEWDGWIGKMTNDLMRENGAGCGECLEVGAWWARKRGGSR